MIICVLAAVIGLACLRTPASLGGRRSLAPTRSFCQHRPVKVTSAALAGGLFGPPARTTIIVGLVASPDLPPDDVVAVALENSVPDAEIVDLVRADEGPPPPLVIERKHLIYEWGASSAALEVLMWSGRPQARWSSRKRSGGSSHDGERRLGHLGGIAPSTPLGRRSCRRTPA